MALAHKGDVDAQYNVAALYDGGRGVTQSFARAAQWLRLAAERKFAPAQYMLGRMYQAGDGVAKDSTAATRWIRAAAEQGLAAAQYDLANAFDNLGERDLPIVTLAVSHSLPQEPGPLAWSEKYAWVIWIVLIAAVGLMLALIARNMGRLKPEE